MDTSVNNGCKRSAPARRPRRVALAAALALAALSGSAAAVNLEQAYEAALKHDPTFRMNYYENEAGKESRILGRASLLPQVSASYTASRNRAELNRRLSDGRETDEDPRYISRNATIQLRQPLFNLESWARYRQSLASSNEAAARFESNRSEVAVRVVGAYIEALYADDQLASIQAERATYLEQMKVNTRLFEKGEGTKTDMLEIQARLDLSDARVLEAEDQVRTARQTLEGIIGMDPGTLAPLAPGFKFAREAPATFENWRQLALANNPELKAARFALEAAQQEVNKARAGHAPRVDLVASYGKANAETITTLDQKVLNRSIGVQVNIPLYQGGYVNAVSRQAVAALERARSNLDVKTNLVMTELRKSHNQAISSVSKVGALVKASESGALLTRATEQSIKGGVRINLDLLGAQQQLAATQRDLAQARYSYLLGLLRLRAAAGTLTPADVQEIGAYFR